MKTTQLISCGAVTVALLVGTMAANAAPQAACACSGKGKAAKSMKATPRVEVTGSRLKQEVKEGRISATYSPLVVISRDQIQRSGATTVAGVLRRTGANR